MAMAYPEGEVFFSRAGLATSEAHGYHAENGNHFRSHIMVEYIWNVEADHGSKNANEPHGHSHPRTGYTIVKGGGGWKTSYGNFTNLPFSYGPSENNIRRRVQHNLCTSGSRFKAYEKGGSAESWFMTMPMPTTEERWVWLDMVAYIRAIYIPVAYSAGKDYPAISTWVQVNFAVEGTKSIWRGGNTFQGHAMNKTFGLGIWRNNTIGFDITGLTQLLCIPRAMRKYNAYSAKFIKIVHRNDLRTVAVSTSYEDKYDFDWTKVAKSNYGLDIMWNPPQAGSSWILNFFKNTITLAVGFIPLVGPILAIAFPLAWTAIVDPDRFMQEYRNLAPGVDLAAHLIEEIKKGGRDSRSLISDGIINSKSLELPAEAQAEIQEHEEVKPLEEVGRSALFIQAGEVLDVSDSDPGYKKDDDDNDPGEVIVDIPPTEDA